jgi:hypothetical protein
MAEYIKPGSYINEYDKSSYITEGPTTITGIVGTSKKGPANEIVLMTNYSDYVATFGQDSGYLDFFARFFFKYGGNKLLVVRATDEYSYAGIMNVVESAYQIPSTDTLSASDEQINIEYITGTGSGYPSISYWPESGVARLYYNGNIEYFVYRDLSASRLVGCHRGLNGTTPITISTWGKAVTTIAGNRFETANPHGLLNGQNVRFETTVDGVTAGID